ncbi:ImcF domain-containing protein [Pseudomonas syringae pv. actinidiae ICMP 18883]|uniref:ImcF-related family protein n=1 Tax=Pseudomonas syringae TaxID=317 RepID=UPI0003578F80|nr:ImcF-related family protein [Pseudomonas syringae]EPN29921.1 ImcF domain-containing protein [Pseudomonas syringae pv. actinidiae ICMP 18883]
MLAVVLAALVAAGALIWWLLMEPRLLDRAVMRDVLLKGVLLWALLFGMALVTWQIVQNGVRTLVLDTLSLPVPPPEEPDNKGNHAELIQHLRERYGLFWRRKVRLLLVVGEPTHIEAIAPTLTEQRWLEGHGTVLLWGGSAQATLDQSFPAQWRGLSRWRALDGVVWALDTTQLADDAAMGAGVRQLQRLARGLRWQLPLYLWQVCDSAWAQDTRKARPVGCLLPTHFTPAALETALTELLEPLRREGLAQMNGVMGHDFLLRLSRDLQGEGIARWRDALAPLTGEFARGVPLRGVCFSLPVPRTQHDLKHDWSVAPVWHGVLDDQASGRRLGWSVPRVGYALALGLAVVWGAGLLLSFVSNRAQIAQVQTSLAALQQPGNGDAQLSALNELMRELARLDYRAEHLVPWYQRFGLSQNQTLLDALWPRYVEANNRWIRDPAAANLQRQLNALISLPPGSEQRAERAEEAYGQLKAYLMMARPQKADATFLTKAEPVRAGVSPGLWQGLAPNLWQFYGEHLAAHPAWAIRADPKLVAQARQVLLAQMGQRNAQATLYQQVLDMAAHQYPALNLHDMVGATDALTLFSTEASVPGVFTRQAWEGQVRQAIDDIAQARREEIDWVLSDNPTDIAAELSPETLKEHLTERYFQDYATAWLGFLNKLRWHQAGSLPEVIDQLTLMTDIRQSPLIALLNTLAYQGQAGTRHQAMTDSLMTSAQKLINQNNVPVIEPLAQASHSPLEATFGPLLALLGNDPEGKAGNDRLSLQAFLSRVTRVRLKLQQVSNAPDPQEMTQALAQTVFQGKSTDLTDTRSYGRLIAAGLGAEWGRVGQTLFVQPLDDAWQRVLQPSAAGLNSQWQRAIVTDWQGAFAGRYPFADTASDASLPMLGQMIRADSGRIEQFLQRELSGVLRKEGSRWVADSRHSQGLRINPQFLAAINQLSQLADVIYTDGGMGLSFELQGKPVRDVVQTTFILNGAQHQYFNQKEFWQRFSWPGRSDHPGASLSWTSVNTGERLFGDYQGTWGLIRLLEKARITALDDGESRYRMVLKAPDGLGLTWNLRTELGAGPLALLKLRNFTLPTQIFLNDGAAGYAQNGAFE